MRLLVAANHASTGLASTIGRCNRRTLASELEIRPRMANEAMKKIAMAIITSKSENARRRCDLVENGSFICPRPKLPAGRWRNRA